MVPYANEELGRKQSWGCPGINSASFVGTEVRSMSTARVSARIRNGDLPSASPYADYVDVSVVCRVRKSASLFFFRPVV